MSDRSFIKWCVSGDDRAWKEFVARYGALIHHCIRSVLKTYGVCTSALESEAMDIYQEILSSLVRKDYARLKSFRGFNGCSLASWLRTVSMNATVSHLRTLKKSLPLSGDDSCVSRYGGADAATSLKEQLAARETLARLVDCIARLRMQDKFFLELYLNRRLSIRKMRRLMRATAAALYMRKARIIRQLKECFREKGAVFVMR